MNPAEEIMNEESFRNWNTQLQAVSGIKFYISSGFRNRMVEIFS